MAASSGGAGSTVQKSTDAFMSMSAISALTDAIAIDTQLADAVLKQATALQSKFDRHIESKDKFDELMNVVGRPTATQRAKEISEQQNHSDGGLSEQWLTDLQEDNAQLRMTLSKFQSAIDLIMAKHRSQTQELMQGVNVIQAKADNSVREAEEAKVKLETEVHRLSAKLDRALQVMCLSVSEDIKSGAVQTTELERLRTENEGLRELLGIAGVPVQESTTESRTDEV
eukprot:m.34893 g.34893  ORF g.34893 m.34893 type:complete len:228 (-) comp14345_c0_seq1:229-912(-)